MMGNYVFEIIGVRGLVGSVIVTNTLSKLTLNCLSFTMLCLIIRQSLVVELVRVLKKGIGLNIRKEDKMQSKLHPISYSKTNLELN